MKKQYLSDSWIDTRVELKDSTIEGKGIFAKNKIYKGETVIIWGGTLFNINDLLKGLAKHKCIAQIDDGLFIGTRFNEDESIDDYMNHSCDPNIWMKDKVTLIARRDIKTGEEITADYAMFESDDWVGEYSYLNFKCKCGSSLCRKFISDSDWKIEEVQLKYHGHFSPYLNRCIKKL